MKIIGGTGGMPLEQHSGTGGMPVEPHGLERNPISYFQTVEKGIRVFAMRKL